MLEAIKCRCRKALVARTCFFRSAVRPGLTTKSRGPKGQDALHLLHLLAIASVRQRAQIYRRFRLERRVSYDRDIFVTVAYVAVILAIPRAVVDGE